MANRLIPRSDEDFNSMARPFARLIAEDPKRFGIDQSDADALSAAAKLFQEKYQITLTPSGRSDVTVKEKNQARAELKRIITRIAQLIRINDNVDDVSKSLLKLPQRPSKIKRKSCPMEPPRLSFVRALHEGAGGNVKHELSFRAMDRNSGNKPDGATRLELFVDLIPPDMAIPDRPGGNHGGRPWYLRSYSRSPIILHPPMARVPMRVIYWARWADSAGNTGPFSATAVGWIEGGNISSPGQIIGGGRPQPRLHVEGDPNQSIQMDQTFAVALLEAHYQSFTVQQIQPENPKLEVTVVKETKQIEGPVEEAA